MSRSLGELGVPKVRAVESFTWFGEEIGIGNVSDLLMVDFLGRASAIDESDVVAGLALIREAFTQMVAPGDFDRFWKICLREKQDTKDMMRLMQQLVEGLTGRPTKRRSGSSPGRRDGKTKSKRGSSSRAIPPATVVRRLERQGRPELALMVDEHLRSTG